MKQLLAPGNAAILAELAWARLLLAFDFDGTLAPIVSNPAEATMRRRTRERFARLCRLYPCAVISGRSRGDVLQRLGDTEVGHVIGNHGLEPALRSERFLARVRRAHGLLSASLSEWPGVSLEDKRYSLALHYRRSRQKRMVRAAMEARIAALPGDLKIVPGKLVLNVVPRGAPNKGDALLRIRAQERADVALYVGDDVTDEDVFKLDQPGRVLGVRVGYSRSSSAAYYLRTQDEVDELLGRLIDMRRNRSHR